MNNEAHILNGDRPQAVDMLNADNGQAEAFMNRNGAYENDPELLRRKHQEGMSKKAHSVCCRSHNDPLVINFVVTKLIDNFGINIQGYHY